MIGDRLNGIACRLVREETWTKVVAPAIADLQHEAPRGRGWRVRGYIGVWRAVAGGVADEFAADWRRTFTGPDVQQALMHSGIALWVLTEVQGVLIVRSLGIESPGRWTVTLYTLLLPALITSSIPAATAPAAAILARRGSRRVIVAASALVAIMLLAATDQIVARTNQEFREVAAAVERQPVPVPGELRQADTWQARMDFHSRVALCASTVAFAALGIAIARLRPWLLTGLGVVLWAAYMAVFFAVPVTAFSFGVRPPVWSPWIPVVVLFAAAWLARRSRKERKEQRE